MEPHPHGGSHQAGVADGVLRGIRNSRSSLFHSSVFRHPVKAAKGEVDALIQGYHLPPVLGLTLLVFLPVLLTHVSAVVSPHHDAGQRPVLGIPVIDVLNETTIEEDLVMHDGDGGGKFP